MKINCPKCKKEIELGVSKFPPTGIEVVCPSCSAKFRLKSKGRAASASSDDAAASAAEAPAAPPEPPPIETPPPPAPAPAPAAAPADALDDLADLFDEIEQLSADPAAAPTDSYYVRRQTGKIFGPLTLDALVQMLQTGQITGEDEASFDQQQWMPVAQWEEFQGYLPDTMRQAPVGNQSDEPEWEEPAAPARAEAPVTSAPARATVSATATPLRQSPPARPSVPIQMDELAPSPSSEPAYPTVSREPARRVRTALKDEFLDAEPSTSPLKDPKILGLGGVALVLLLGVGSYFLFFQKTTKVPTFKDVRISFRKPYALDSYPIYTRNLLRNIKKQRKQQPNHPKLILFQALALSMYLEHYGPDAAKWGMLQKLIKQLPAPANPKEPPFHYIWLFAQKAAIEKQAFQLLKLSQAMLNRQANHSGALYLRGKAYALSGRRKRAVQIYEKVIQQMSEPARAYFAKGLALLPTKPRKSRPPRKRKPPKKAGKAPSKAAKAPKNPDARPEPPKAPAQPLTEEQKKEMYKAAFDAFYKTTLVVRHHIPAHLEMLKLEPYLPEEKAKLERIWEQVSLLFEKVQEPSLRLSFFLLRYERERRLGRPKEALAWLVKAQRFAGSSKRIQKLLPKAYLETHDYKKIWPYLMTKVQRRQMGTKPRYSLEHSVMFVEVLFRTSRWDYSEPSPRLLLAGCSACSKDAGYWYWRGRINEAKRNWEYADRAYLRVLELNPNSLAATAGRARLALQINNKAGAQPFIEKLEKIKPAHMTDIVDQLSVMELWLMLEKHEAMLEISKQALPLHPTDELLHRLTGLAQIALKEYAKAEYHFSRALKVQPSEPVSLRGLGVALEKQKLYDKARNIFLSYLEKNAQDGEAYYLLGRIYLVKKEFPKAVEALKKSIDLSDKIPDAQFCLGKAYEQSKSLSERDSYKIREAYERAVQLDPNNRTYLYQLARHYYKNRKNNLALQIYTRLLRAKQNDEQKAKVHFERGKLFFEDRNWRAALNDFQKVQRLFPDYQPIGLWLGDTFREMRRASQAARWYQYAIVSIKKIPTNPNDPNEATKQQQHKIWLASIHGYLGDIFRDRQQSGKAIQHYQAALRNNPQGYGYHRQLGYLFKDRRRWSACRYHLQKYLRMVPASQIVDRQEVENDVRGCR